MKLSVFERILLLNILPVESNFTTLKIVRKMKENLSFTEEEHKALNFKQAGETFSDENGKKQVVGEGQIKWTAEADGEKEIEIGEKATDIIADALKKLNDANPPRLRNEHMSLYEKFVEIE